MIKQRTIFPKPLRQKKSKNIPQSGSENSFLPSAFNMKGYFSPQHPYDQEYHKKKQQVFQKYRKPCQQLLPIQSIQHPIYVKKKLITTTSKDLSSGQDNKYSMSKNKNSTKSHQIAMNLLKNYIIRKEKKELIEAKKFSVIPDKNWQKLKSQSTSGNRKSNHYRAQSQLQCKSYKNNLKAYQTLSKESSKPKHRTIRSQIEINRYSIQCYQ